MCDEHQQHFVILFQTQVSVTRWRCHWSLGKLASRVVYCNLLRCIEKWGSAKKVQCKKVKCKKLYIKRLGSAVVEFGIMWWTVQLAWCVQVYHTELNRAVGRVWEICCKFSISNFLRVGKQTTMLWSFYARWQFCQPINYQEGGGKEGNRLLW